VHTNSFKDSATFQYHFGDEMKNETGWTCDMYWNKESAYRVFVGIPEGKGTIKRRKRGWENVKMHFREIK
jgi:hypothetical protein